MAHTPDAPGYQPDGYPEVDPDTGRARVHGTLGEPEVFVDPDRTRPITLPAAEDLTGPPTDRFAVQTLPEKPEEETNEEEPPAKKPRSLHPLFLVALVAIPSTAASLITDASLKGWIIGGLLTAAAVAFVAACYTRPLKHAKLWRALTGLGFIVLLVLSLAGTFGRLTNLSTQEKKDAASAQHTKDVNSYTQMLQFATDCNVVLPPNPAVDSKTLSYAQGRCTVQFDLNKTSVRAFPTSALDESKTNVNEYGTLTLALRPDSGITFYLNVDGFPGPVTEVPETDRQALSRYYDHR